MPIDVDEVQRRKAIAEATLAVAARDGARAVTIRAVAKELGGSTAMVTNYVPTRTALITNAVRAAESRWRSDLEAHLGELTGADRLRATVEWHLSTEPEDLLLRTLWVEMLSTAHADPHGVDRQEPREARQEFLDASTAAGVPDAGLAADVLSLLTRGYYVSTLEEPGYWTPERAGRVARAVVGALMDS
ncbi:TetR family transcriptional regulator C-terminal domain-containing protein [Streptomyces sp. ISL-36]|uniref:TetR/AcrR family transcriptional regulator n=1 Tax=Streptomyces sp. ISL-36 TaxID=2819182 RepID=UPI001BEBDEEE|nr:TetR family transcriptional regulator C-terminal domain-containing protein [Streptomyces sp. ISL-36]MBT2441806.1 TetR family transcriptional regulator C-terminal domain-containing protein [Streptomyces sp. ISL-36]